VQRGQSQALLSDAQWQDQSQWAPTEIWEVASEHQEILFHCEGDQALAQVVQGGGGVSVLGDTEKPSRHGPGQTALAGPGGARGLDHTTSRGAFQPQSFCHSVWSVHKATHPQQLCMPFVNISVSLYCFHICEVNCTGPANPSQLPHSTPLLLYSVNRSKLLPCYFITLSWSVWLVSKCEKPFDICLLHKARSHVCSGTKLLLKHGTLTMTHFHGKRYAHSLPPLPSDPTWH